jgi:hypothetical protein
MRKFGIIFGVGILLLILVKIGTGCGSGGGNNPQDSGVPTGVTVNLPQGM